MDWDYLYQERAAIKQCLGNMSREQAEKEAREEVDALKPYTESRSLWNY